MADIFGSQDLFSEFERTNDRSDRILMSKFKEDESKDVAVTKINDNAADSDEPTYAVGFSDDSDSDYENGTVEFDEDGKRIETESSNIGKILENIGGDGNDLVKLVKKLQNDIHKLRKDRDRLKKINRAINPSKYVTEENGPEVQVLYMNSGISSKYKVPIERYVKNLLADKSAILSDDVAEKRVTHSSRCLEDPSDDKMSRSSRVRRIRSCTMLGCSQFYSDFTIDLLGWPVTNHAPSVHDGWDIPHYQQVYFVPLPEEGDGSAPTKNKRPKASCFNCGEGHTLRECKAPYDQQRINENRRKFQSEAPKFKKTISQQDAECDPKFKKFKAGVISDELKDALGLRRKELPSYIYKMRVLGYPPGHELALSEQSSGLSMYDKDGQEVAPDGQQTEDGEVDSNAPVVSTDVSKIISYPGYNVPVGDEYIDDSQHLRMPPMCRTQSKEMMAKLLSSQKKGVKRTHSDSSSQGGAPSRHKRTRTEEAQDMDISDDENCSSHGLKNSPWQPMSSWQPFYWGVDQNAPPDMCFTPDAASSYDYQQNNPPVSWFGGDDNPLPSTSSYIGFNQPPLPNEPPPPPPPPPESPPRKDKHGRQKRRKNKSPTDPAANEHWSPPSTDLEDGEIDKDSPSELCDTDQGEAEYNSPSLMPLERWSRLDTSHEPGTQWHDTKSFDNHTPARPAPRQASQRVDSSRTAASSPGSTVSTGGTDTGGTDTLEDLETQRALLQQQLAAAEGTSDADIQVMDSYSSQEEDTFVPPLPPTPVRPPLPTDTPPQTPTGPSQRRSFSGGAVGTPEGAGVILRTPSSGGSRSMSLGTPVSGDGKHLKTKGLPESSKFSEGIAQHIPFENLPGSTGTFERMKAKLEQIRAKTKDS